MYRDGINYSQIHLYQNMYKQYKTHIIHKYVDGRGPGVGHSVLNWSLGGSFVCTEVHVLKHIFNQSFE